MPNFGTLNQGRNSTGGVSIDIPGQTRASARKIGPNESKPFEISANSQAGGLNLPMIMATIMVFMQVGRPFDQFLTGYHIPAVIGSIAIVVTFFTPWAPVIRSKAGIALLMFIGIMAFASLFSIWRGGSAAYVQFYVELNLVSFCLLGAAPATVGQARWLALVALAACAFNVALGANFDENHRLRLTDSMYGNSDDVALIGGLCIPLVLLFASRAGKVFGSLIGAAGVIACLAAVGLSAARFGLISLAVMAFVYFVRSGGAARVGIFFGVCVLAAGAVVFLPKSSLERFSTITAMISSNDEQSSSNEAIGSMQERKQLSKDAFQAFISHPVLGVGPDVFVAWRWDVLHRRGQPAHNTYLQTAAENGLLGVIFYISFLVAVFMALQRCTKESPGWEDGRKVALALQTSLIYFMVSALFLNCLSHSHQFVFAGLAVALERLKRSQAENMEGEQEAPLEAAILPSSNGNPLRPLPARVRTEGGRPVNGERPVRYRFNRSVASSRRD